MLEILMRIVIYTEEWYEKVRKYKNLHAVKISRR
jgi:hypothetical protein